MDIEPAAGYVCVTFLGDYADDETTETERYDAAQPSSSSSAVCFAQCNSVGKDVKRCKRGDVVLVMEYARQNGIKVSDDDMLIDQWNVVGIVKNK